MSSIRPLHFYVHGWSGRCLSRALSSWLLDSVCCVASLSVRHGGLFSTWCLMDLMEFSWSSHGVLVEFSRAFISRDLVLPVSFGLALLPDDSTSHLPWRLPAWTASVHLGHLALASPSRHSVRHAAQRRIAWRRAVTTMLRLQASHAVPSSSTGQGPLP